VCTEGVKMRGTRSPSDANRHSADKTVSIGIPYNIRLPFHAVDYLCFKVTHNLSAFHTALLLQQLLN